jgi:hypothetical protein
LDGGNEIINKDESVEEWVKRVNQEPIWREVAFLVDLYKKDTVVKKQLKETIVSLRNRISELEEELNGR